MPKRFYYYLFLKRDQNASLRSHNKNRQGSSIPLMLMCDTNAVLQLQVQLIIYLYKNDLSYHSYTTSLLTRYTCWSVVPTTTASAHSLSSFCHSTISPTSKPPCFFLFEACRWTIKASKAFRRVFADFSSPTASTNSRLVRPSWGRGNKRDKCP
jgi:hypothetical protein